MKLNSYDFDDLLVACSEEITINGFSSTSIPRTIKDWLAGKIIESLPRILLNKLLEILVEQRDVHELVTCQDKISKDYSQITITIYKNQQMKAWHEAKADGISIESQPVFNEKSETSPELNNFFAVENILFPETAAKLQKMGAISEHFSVVSENGNDNGTEPILNNRDGLFNTNFHFFIYLVSSTI